MDKKEPKEVFVERLTVGQSPQISNLLLLKGYERFSKSKDDD